MRIEEANKKLEYTVLSYCNKFSIFRYAMKHFNELREEEHQISILWCEADGSQKEIEEVTFEECGFSRYATPDQAKDATITIYSEKELAENKERYGIYFYLPRINNTAYFLNVMPGDNATLNQFFEEGKMFIIPAEPFAYFGGGATVEDFLEAFKGEPEEEDAKNAIINGNVFWWQEWEKAIYLIANGEGREWCIAEE